MFSAKHAKFEDTQRREKKLFVNTPVLAALVRMSVFFSAFLILGVSEFPCLRDVFDR